jgi:hypothetical protein
MLRHQKRRRRGSIQKDRKTTGEATIRNLTWKFDTYRQDARNELCSSRVREKQGNIEAQQGDGGRSMRGQAHERPRTRLRVKS